ncbi:MAG TPA: DMT family transporter, partial [Candidatus Eisenbacteria bacterium]
GSSIARGRHPAPVEWLGIFLTLGGLYWLVRPGLAAPPIVGALLMATAGMAWGFYSLIGRGSVAPLQDTAGNFARATLLAMGAGLIALALSAPVSPARPSGYLLAVASGAVTSALGYVVWYAALKGLTATRAALVQTLVPVLSALGGIALLGENASWRLVGAGALILAGIVLTLRPRKSA